MQPYFNQFPSKITQKLTSKPYKFKKWPLLLLASLIGSFVLGRLSNHSVPYSQPYSIFLLNPSDKDLKLCQQDPNCMDMGLMSDLPQRDLEADLKEGMQ